MDQLPTIDISDIRYFTLSDGDMYNFQSVEIFFNYLRDRSKLFGRFADPESFDEYLVKSAFSENMTSPYDYTTITTWDMLTHYIRLYLNRVISSTPFYTGPYSLETTYILSELLNIVDTGILPIDSEPGFFIETSTFYDSYLQLPYLQLLAPVPLLEYIISGFGKFIETSRSIGTKYMAIALIDGTIIRDYNHVISDNFPILSETYNVGSITFGVQVPPTKDKLEEFLSYILTNEFFTDIRKIIRIGLGR